MPPEIAEREQDPTIISVFPVARPTVALIASAVPRLEIEQLEVTGWALVEGPNGRPRRVIALALHNGSFAPFLLEYRGMKHWEVEGRTLISGLHLGFEPVPVPPAKLLAHRERGRFFIKLERQKIEILRRQGR
jgi:hypothetical protein